MDSRFPSPRQHANQERAGANKLGSPRWGDWYFPEVKSLIESEPFGKWPEEFGRPLDELSDALTSGSATDGAAIQRRAEQAAAAMHRLADRLAAASFSSSAIDRLLGRAAGEHFTPRNWDEAAQRLLTLDALWSAREFFQSQSGRTAGEPERAVTAALESIREKLQFPAAQHKPSPPKEAASAEARFDSPARFDPAAIRNEAFQPACKRIRDLLAAKAPK